MRGALIEDEKDDGEGKEDELFSFLFTFFQLEMIFSSFQCCWGKRRDREEEKSFLIMSRTGWIGWGGQEQGEMKRVKNVN